MKHPTAALFAQSRDAEAYQREFEQWKKVPDVRKARVILEHPVFGDSDHIRAVRLLSMVEEIQELSGGLSDRTGRYFPCPCCEGSGGSSCCGECGHDIDCHRCKGEGRIRASEIDYLSPEEVKAMLETARKEAA
jgi:hypothetical protein